MIIFVPASFLNVAIKTFKQTQETFMSYRTQKFQTLLSFLVLIMSLPTYQITQLLRTKFRLMMSYTFNPLTVEAPHSKTHEMKSCVLDNKWSHYIVRVFMSLVVTFNASERAKFILSSQQMKL